MTAATTPLTGAEVFEIVQSGATRKASLVDLISGHNDAGSLVGTETFCVNQGGALKNLTVESLFQFSPVDFACENMTAGTLEVTSNAVLFNSTGFGLFPAISWNNLTETISIGNENAPLIYYSRVLDSSSYHVPGTCTFDYDTRFNLMASFDSGAESSGDISFLNIGEGPIIRSPDGSYWRVSVDNSGNISATSV